jgi:tRNA pseudouridine55 synthase
MNGVLVIDKPAGKTSYEVVQEARKILKAGKAGHTGTLDPLATGVLPICLNEATKLVQFLSGDSKDYEATLLLGVETDTLDVEGNILSEVHCPVRTEQIEEVLHGCLGRMDQKPPRYSAIKVRGKALYHWARKGVPVEIPPRTVEIHDIALLNVRLPYVTFFVSCSKGTYIRSLCADIGERLGGKACLAGLRRVRSGRFRQEQAVSLEQLRNQREVVLAERWISMVDALAGYSAIAVNEQLAARLKMGHQPFVADMNGNNMPSLAVGDMVKFVLGKETLVAVGEMLHASEMLPLLDTREKIARIVRIFHS